MSLAPDNLPVIFDLIALGGLTGTGTGVGSTIAFPAGKKALQVTLPTSATATIKIQNSLDKFTWFDVSSSTVASQSFISEVDSVIPYWRANISAYTTSTLALVAMMATVIPK